MPGWKLGLTTWVLVAGLASPSMAQTPSPASKVVAGGATSAYPANSVTSGLPAYYGMTPNFANYGLSGTYPSNAGYGYSGYGPGPQFGAHYPSTTESRTPAAPSKPVSAPSKAARPKAKPGTFGDGGIRNIPLLRKGL